MKYVISSNQNNSCHIAAKTYNGIVTFLLYSGPSFVDALSAIHKDAKLDVTWLREI